MIRFLIVWHLSRTSRELLENFSRELQMMKHFAFAKHPSQSLQRLEFSEQSHSLQCTELKVMNESVIKSSCIKYNKPPEYPGQTYFSIPAAIPKSLQQGRVCQFVQ